MRVRFAGAALAAIVATLVAGPALAMNLGLQPDDTILFVEFDGLKVNGDGGAFDLGLGALGGIAGDARGTSMTVNRPGDGAVVLNNLLTSGSEIVFRADLSSANIIVNPGTVNVALAEFVGGGTTPDFALTIGATVIVQGNFTTPLGVSGVINTANVSFLPTFSAFANITITGGLTAIVDALGGLGGAGVLDMDASVFNFAPLLGNVAADGDPFDENFSFAFSGKLTPTSAAPFVPEPSSALLTGGGLLILLAVARRARGRGI